MTETPPEQSSEVPAAAFRRKPSVLGSAALILGLCSFICHPVGLVLGVAGIVLGIVALPKDASIQGRPVNGIVAGIVGIFIVHFWLVPRLMESRDMAQKAVCSTNLSDIGKGISMYNALYEDAYPANLEVLVTEDCVSRKMLHCPAVERTRPCDYFYFYQAPPGEPAEGPVDIPDDLVLACDLRGNHREQRNVLYASGSVKGFEEKDFQAEVAKPVNAAFAAALRKAEGP